MIPPEFEMTHRMLTSVYPDGVEGPEYLALLVVLKSHMSARVLAKAMQITFGRDYYAVYGCDIGRALDPEDGPVPELVEQVRRKLMAAGFEQWTHS